MQKVTQSDGDGQLFPHFLLLLLVQCLHSGTVGSLVNGTIDKMDEINKRRRRRENVCCRGR